MNSDGYLELAGQTGGCPQMNWWSNTGKKGSPVSHLLIAQIGLQKGCPSQFYTGVSTSLKKLLKISVAPVGLWRDQEHRIHYKGALHFEYAGKKNFAYFLRDFGSSTKPNNSLFLMHTDPVWISWGLTYSTGFGAGPAIEACKGSYCATFNVGSSKAVSYSVFYQF